MKTLFVLVIFLVSYSLPLVAGDENCSTCSVTTTLSGHPAHDSRIEEVERIHDEYLRLPTAPKDYAKLACAFISIPRLFKKKVLEPLRVMGIVHLQPYYRSIDCDGKTLIQKAAGEEINLKSMDRSNQSLASFWSSFSGANGVEIWPNIPQKDIDFLIGRARTTSQTGYYEALWDINIGAGGDRLSADIQDEIKAFLSR